jgi:hypothetical protein
MSLLMPSQTFIFDRAGLQQCENCSNSALIHGAGTGAAAVSRIGIQARRGWLSGPIAKRPENRATNQAVGPILHA